MEWDIHLTEQVEDFLDALYESDAVTHRLVNQAILVLERNGPGEAALWSTASPPPSCPT